MSHFHEEEYACPKCGHEGKATVYESITVELSPELKPKIMDFSLFSFACPGCGAMLSIPESFLYHDMSKNLMLHLFPEEDRGDWPSCAEADLLIKTGKYGEKLDPPVAGPSFGGDWRTCFGANEIVEKILIYDMGIDDRVIEAVKLIIVTQNQEKFQGKVPRLLFAGLDDDGKWQIEAFIEETREPVGVLAIDPGWAAEAFVELKEQAIIKTMVEEPFVSYRKIFMLQEAGGPEEEPTEE